MVVGGAVSLGVWVVLPIWMTLSSDQVSYDLIYNLCKLIRKIDK